MLNIFQYAFMIRALEAGIIIAIIAPLIGIYLVIKRYSLIADTLSHVSLAGVAVGLLIGVNPIITAIASALLSSVFIERLRSSKKIYGESALAIFLSGSLAIAITLLGLAHGFNVDLFNYLFGSIVTVKAADIFIIGTLGIVIIALSYFFYKELVYTAFDEESAIVSGLPVPFINTVLIVLSALTVALAIPIVGILLISALIVIPVVAALQLKQSFRNTLIYAEVFSIFSVIFGIIASFYLNLSTGGTIVIMTILILILILIFKR